VLRGDIYGVDFGPGLGREPSGRLPAGVISNDTFNIAPFALVLIPGLPPSQLAATRALGVLVPAAESGLPADVAFICYHIRAVDPPRVGPRLLGRLSEARMAAIDHILLSILGLNTPPTSGRRASPRP